MRGKENEWMIVRESKWMNGNKWIYGKGMEKGKKNKCKGKRVSD